MPGNSKPKKRYQPRPVVRPLNMRDPWMTEGDVHAALVALEGRQAREEHLAMLAAHADLVRRLAAPQSAAERQANSILRMLALAMAREGQQLAASEEAAIRAAVQVTLPVVQAARNADIHRAAMASLAEVERRGGFEIDERAA